MLAEVNMGHEVEITDHDALSLSSGLQMLVFATMWRKEAALAIMCYSVAVCQYRSWLRGSRI